MLFNGETISREQLLKYTVDQEPKFVWGNWRINPHANTLDYFCPERGKIYEIPLDEMVTSAGCLKWIFQVAFKTWMTNQDRSDLLEAILDTINPQTNLCLSSARPDDVMESITALCQKAPPLDDL